MRRTCLRSLVTVPLVALVAFCWPPRATAQGTFVTLDYPVAGVTDTEATGINPSGVIVGRWYDSSHVHHGFMLQNGNYTSIDVPGAVANSNGTDPEWINSNGTISGTYQVSNGNSYAFTLRNGVYSTIQYPGAAGTWGFGIGNDGSVVGPQCSCGFTTARGYMYSQGVFTAINYPGAMGTFPTGLHDPNWVVGAWIDFSYHYHAFVLQNGVYSSVDYPGSSFTWLTGISPQGIAVGFYVDGATGKQHGLLYYSGTGQMISVDVPVAGSYSAEVNGVDPEGDIVGRYISSDGHTHGFFWGAD